jgi:hypothetical protein
LQRRAKDVALGIESTGADGKKPSLLPLKLCRMVKAPEFWSSLWTAPAPATTMLVVVP